MAIEQYLMHQSSKHMLPESKMGPAARCLHESSCGAQMWQVTQRRDRPRIYLYILCSWVYQHVSLCPKLNKFWLRGERVWSCRRRGGSRDRLLSSLVMQQHKCSQSCGQWGGGWASRHYPVPSFSIQLKVLDNLDTTAFRRNELLCSCSLFFVCFFLLIYSSLYLLYAHRLPVHLGALC